ncbi:hypothetical protein [Alloalcanivorax xenomutans]|uniref:hypothetical protein n=1 Tax=Alloalcanivorax xenomutans TaxID=1094342 RepID=UPI00292D1FC2|nr:hypothetical protein [Alloalcanivorax xenomutans]WOA33157.1 hypothetical protein RVY87_08720 [Alloalcanivorax xenomutans]
MLSVVVVALSSSALTLIVVSLWGHFYFQPKLRRTLEKDMEKQTRQAAEVIGESVEAAVKRGLADGLRNLPTREILEETSRSLARSGSEIVGERLGKFFGKKER